MLEMFSHVAVIGAGAMGRGIAQLAAQAGARVKVFDSNSLAAQAAVDSINEQWRKLLAKGKLSQEAYAACADRLSVATSLTDLSDSALVVEAVVEDMAVKQGLFRQLEGIVSSACVLATNTSSLSVTAMATCLIHRGRFAGFHFFNPVPLMRVAEVIAGLQTQAATVERLHRFTKAMGHAPVLAQDTPGFIVNHAGRGFGTEALRIVGESVTNFATVDRILKDQVGFRLGPFELMDLTGLDVSHPVMASVYHQYFEEPRYRPSVISAQRLAGGVLGKKSGAGFYDYSDGVAVVPADQAVPVCDHMPPVWVSPRAARRSELLALVHALGATIETGASPSSNALCLVAPLGFDVSTVAVVERLDPSRTVGIDMLQDDALVRRRVLATNPATRIDMRDAAHALFARDGKAVSVIRDSGGFVTQRVLATIVNIACDMCQQNICTPTDLDLAVNLGLGYPKGPLALGDAVGATNLLEVLFNLQTVYGDPRYRPSPWLRRRGAIGLSLLHEEPAP